MWGVRFASESHCGVKIILHIEYTTRQNSLLQKKSILWCVWLFPCLCYYWWMVSPWEPSFCFTIMQQRNVRQLNISNILFPAILQLIWFTIFWYIWSKATIYFAAIFLFWQFLILKSYYRKIGNGITVKPYHLRWKMIFFCFYFIC